MGYDAFISYSHDVDDARAEAIEAGLERFAKPWYRRQSLNVFRDRTGLSANPGLWTSIAENLDDSEWLVVLCSPEAAASPWVGREIEHWVATKPAGHLLPVLTAGELLWDDAAGAFDMARSSAAHPALASGFSEEPLWVDLRFAAAPEQRTLRDVRFRDAIADLAAPMHGVAKDQLIGEDIRQHRRTMRFAWGAVATLVLLAIATVFGAAAAARNAQEAERLADEVLAANASLDELKAQQAAVEQSLNESQAELDATQTELDAANANADAANADAANANANAAAADTARDAANGERDAAVTESQRLQGVADAAQLGAAAALFTQASAEDLAAAAQAAASAASEDATRAAAAAAEATRLQLKADEQAKIAEVKRVQAENDRAEAEAAAAEAEQHAAEVDAQAESARLANLASNSDLQGRQLDVALLLAAESASVRPDSGGAAFAAVGATGDAISPEARGALLSTLSASTGVSRFLSFGCDVRVPEHCVAAPRRLGKVAVSPDGRSVVAVEDSGAIQSGRRSARLYLWRDIDGTDPTVELLADDVGCVTDLQWLSPTAFTTVEGTVSGSSCLDPALVNGPEGVPFALSRVRLWEPSTATIVDFCDLFGSAGYAPWSRSPVAVSSDGRHASLNCALVDDGTILAGAALSVLFDTGTFAWELVPTHALGLTFSPSGRYATGQDFLGDLSNGVPQAIWDLQNLTDSDPSLCPAGCFEKVPLVRADLTFPLTFDAEEHYAVASVVDADGFHPELAVVDVAVGAQVGRVVVPSGVAGASFLPNHVLVVSDLAGGVTFVHWPTRQTLGVSASPASVRVRTLSTFLPPARTSTCWCSSGSASQTIRHRSSWSTATRSRSSASCPAG
jgi:hypothetical protein